MTARKNSIRKATKNHGHPIFRAREDVGLFGVKGNVYNEICVHATMQRCSLTLFNTMVPHKDRPIAMDITFDWKWFDWLYAPIDIESLMSQVETLINEFKTKRVPPKVLEHLRSSQFPSTMV